MFITFEGLDGCGKTTQAKLLYECFCASGIKCLLTHEPGGTPIGEFIRNVLKSNEMKIFPLTELLLFSAARAQHVQEVIVPALESGVIVISDRFADSGIAYQGAGRGIGTAYINELTTGGLLPDVTFLLDILPQDALARRFAECSPDRIESEKLDFFYHVREEYVRMANSEPERFCIIDATKEIDEIFAEIKNHLNHRGFFYETCYGGNK
ncbi:MAG: dTMP kinase [Clostridiales bacterium]|nr:dTMP kinase [Clostridiales bacterium]